MSDAPAVEAWFQGGGLLIALLPAAFILGLLLRRGLAAILQERLGGAARFPVIELTAVGLATAGWWWEIVSLGQIPCGSSPT